VAGTERGWNSAWLEQSVAGTERGWNSAWLEQSVAGTELLVWGKVLGLVTGKGVEVSMECE
jgi:hypothetical protein